MKTVRKLLALLFLVTNFENSFAQTARSGPTSSTTVSSASGGNNIPTINYELIILPNNRILFLTLSKNLACSKISGYEATTKNGDLVSITINQADIDRFNNNAVNTEIQIPVKLNTSFSEKTKIVVSLKWNFDDCGEEITNENTSLLKANKLASTEKRAAIKPARAANSKIPPKNTIITYRKNSEDWHLEIQDNYFSPKNKSELKINQPKN